MKLHFSFRDGCWCVWSYRAMSLSLPPQAIGETVEEAFMSYFLLRGAENDTYSMDSWLSSSTHCYKG